MIAVVSATWLMAAAAGAPFPAPRAGALRSIDVVVQASALATLAPIARSPAWGPSTARAVFRAIGHPDAWLTLRQGELLRVVVEDKEPRGAGAVAAVYALQRPAAFGVFAWRGMFRHLNGSGASGPLDPPVLRAAPITSAFGLRERPLGTGAQWHAAVDLAVPVGTPAYASEAGVVEAVGMNAGAGRFVLVRHAGGLTTSYFHLSASFVSLHQRVRRGQQLGTSGNSGNSTGPHLHYAVVVRGTPVDPERYAPLRRLRGTDYLDFLEHILDQARRRSAVAMTGGGTVRVPRVIEQRQGSSRDQALAKAADTTFIGKYRCCSSSKSATNPYFL